MKINQRFLAGAMLIGLGSFGGLGSAVANEGYYSQGEAACLAGRIRATESNSAWTTSVTAFCKVFDAGGCRRRPIGQSCMQENRAIRHQERQYLADGQVSRFEYDRLDRHLDRANQHIRFERHDQDTRGYSHPNLVSMTRTEIRNAG